MSCKEHFNRGYCDSCTANAGPTCRKCTKVCHKKQRILVKQFTSGAPDPSPNQEFTPLKNEECEDYSQVFLSHAQLYVIADKYDIPPLCHLTLHKIWATLKTFTLYPKRISDICSLIHYSFESFLDSVESSLLCNMLIHFSACIYEELVACDDFKELVNQFPLFTTMLMRKMSERLY